MLMMGQEREKEERREGDAVYVIEEEKEAVGKKRKRPGRASTSSGDLRKRNPGLGMRERGSQVVVGSVATILSLLLALNYLTSKGVVRGRGALLPRGANNVICFVPAQPYPALSILPGQSHGDPRVSP